MVPYKLSYMIVVIRVYPSWWIFIIRDELSYAFFHVVVDVFIYSYYYLVLIYIYIYVCYDQTILIKLF
jgi:hypothetical protein